MKLHDKGLIYQGKLLLHVLISVVVAVSSDVMYSHEVWCFWHFQDLTWSTGPLIYRLLFQTWYVVYLISNSAVCLPFLFLEVIGLFLPGSRIFGGTWISIPY